MFEVKRPESKQNLPIKAGDIIVTGNTHYLVLKRENGHSTGFIIIDLNDLNTASVQTRTIRKTQLSVGEEITIQGFTVFYDIVQDIRTDNDYELTLKYS